MSHIHPDRPHTLILASSLSGVIHKPDFVRAMGKGRRLLFVPTAAVGEGWYPEYETDIEPFEARGYTVTIVDLSGLDDKVDPNFFDDYDAVYLSGGNTFFLLKHMKRTWFSEHLKAALERGLVFVGSSAGAIVATPDIGYAEGADDRSLGDGDDAGLGLVDFAILPHMDHDGMGETVRNLYDSWAGAYRVIALNEDQAVLVEGSRIRII